MRRPGEIQRWKRHFRVLKTSLPLPSPSPDWVEGGGRRLDLREATAQLPSARLFSPVLPLLRDDTVMDAMDVERESRQSGDADSTLAVTTQALLDEGLTAELVEHASVVVAEQFEEQLGSDATLAQEDLRRVLQQATQFEAEDVSVVVRAVFRGSAGTRMPVRDVLEFFFDGAASRSLLPAKDANDLLAEERRCLNERCADAARIFGSGAGRPETATLVPVILHVRQVAQQLSDGLCFLEAGCFFFLCGRKSSALFVQCVLRKVHLGVMLGWKIVEGGTE